MNSHTKSYDDKSVSYGNAALRKLYRATELASIIREDATSRP